MNSVKTIPKEWKKVKLGDVVKFRNGKAHEGEIKETGKYIVVNSKFVSTDGNIKKYSDSNLEPLFSGDIALVMSDVPNGRAIGKCFLVLEDNKYTLNQRVCAIKPIQGSSQYFYQMLNRNRYFLSFDNGVGQTNLRKKEVLDCPLILPPLLEQNKIAEILSSVDEEIGKVDQEIKKIEELKRGLMTELLTKGIGHKKFKKTKLGMIPEEWEIVRLEDVAQVERGKFSNRPRNDPKFYGGKYPFIQTGDVVNSDGKIQKYNQTLNEEGLAISRMFKKGTVVITIAANIGDTGILEFDCCFPDSLVGIIAKENMNNIFLEYYLRTRKDYLNSIATQSAQKNINLEKLRPLLIIKPKIEEQKQVAAILSEVDNKIDVNKQTKNKLAELKKGLMQDLLSGRVRV